MCQCAGEGPSPKQSTPVPGMPKRPKGAESVPAANDFEKATDIARKMVCQYGMSDLGPLTFGERDDLVFLGRDLAMHKNFSEKTAELIDEEVKKIISRSYNRAKSLMEKNKDKLKEIAETLLEREVLSSDEIDDIIKGKPPRKKPAPEKPAAKKSAKVKISPKTEPAKA